jgi:hypothetical protein
MKRFIGTVAVILALLACEYAHAQVYGQGNGFGCYLDEYGRFRIYTPDTLGTRQMDRATILMALSKTNVGDYTEDANSVSGPTITAGGPNPRVGTVLFDNSYTSQQPKVKVRLTTYTWSTYPFVIARYTVINDTSISCPLYLGIAVAPRPGGTYGGATITYDATKKVAYFFRSGTPMYVGLKILGGVPYSFHVLDYAAYSPADPSGDYANDSTRYNMTALAGFDNSYTDTSNGSIFNLNVGSRMIAVGDSSTFGIAYLVGTSLSALQAAADSADARYAKLFTSVQQTSPIVPQSTSLSQNYPNPFNPSTHIEFALASSSQTRLTVYDALGRLVATLVDQQLPAGVHSCTFDAGGLAGGVYFYRLDAGKYSSVHQMLLIK